ncbi:MAG: hypothetical protein QOE40_678 [Actinomycetota bacterium]|nr:hypothetical protein [Actinomycetota bacterium]
MATFTTTPESWLLASGRGDGTAGTASRSSAGAILGATVDGATATEMPRSSGSGKSLDSGSTTCAPDVAAAGGVGAPPEVIVTRSR